MSGAWLGTVRERLRRDQVAVFSSNLRAFLIRMEACGGAHNWARKLRVMDCPVKLIALSLSDVTSPFGGADEILGDIYSTPHLGKSWATLTRAAVHHGVRQKQRERWGGCGRTGFELIDFPHDLPGRNRQPVHAPLSFR